MNREEIRNRAKRKREREVAKKRRLLLFVVSVLFIGIGGIVIGNNFSSAQVNAEETNVQQYYKSITIDAGDSLWSISNEYCTGYTMRTDEYISEVKRLNNLSSDEIHQGQNLMIIYFENEIQ